MPSRRWALVAGGVVPAIVVVGGSLAFGAYSTWLASDDIAPGVSVCGEPLGGLSRTEAEDRLSDGLKNPNVNLIADTATFEVPLEDLGAHVDTDAALDQAYAVGRSSGTIGNFLRVYGSRAEGDKIDAPIVWDKKRLIRKLRTFNRTFHIAPTDASISVTDQGVQIVPEVVGRSINIGASASALQKNLRLGTSDFHLIYGTVQPSVVASALAGTDVLLASYKTHFNPGDKGRTVNVKTAAKAVDGKVVMPGKVFSFNHATGERTAAKGYEMAHIFLKQEDEEKAEIVEGLAGGTCQVSSTLYNAVLTLLDKTPGALKVTERCKHSLPVKYVPKDRDATVAWPSIDLRFRNNLPEPVYIRTLVHGAHLTVSLWGRVPGTEVVPPLPLPSPTALPPIAVAPTPASTPEALVTPPANSGQVTIPGIPVPVPNDANPDDSGSARTSTASGRSDPFAKQPAL